MGQSSDKVNKEKCHAALRFARLSVDERFHGLLLLRWQPRIIPGCLSPIGWDCQSCWDCQSYGWIPREVPLGVEQMEQEVRVPSQTFSFFSTGPIALPLTQTLADLAHYLAATVSLLMTSGR
eukprot:s4653_g4.t2